MTLIKAIEDFDAYRSNSVSIEQKIQWISELDKKINLTEEKANHFSNNVKIKMELLRENVDSLEAIVPKEYWPMPTYIDMLKS